MLIFKNKANLKLLPSDKISHTLILTFTKYMYVYIPNSIVFRGLFLHEFQVTRFKKVI